MLHAAWATGHAAWATGNRTGPDTLRGRAVREPPLPESGNGPGREHWRRLVEGEFRTYRADDVEVRALRRRMTSALFQVCEHLLGRWQDAGLPLRPTARGFALQAPLGERLQSIAWVYAPDARHPEPRLEVAIDLLARRGVPAQDLEALRERLDAYGDEEGAAGLATVSITTSLSTTDAERLAGALVQFARSLS